jgi:hypothetical protein
MYVWTDSVYNPRRVDVFETSEDLVDEEHHVIVTQTLRLYDAVQVRTHQVVHQIYVLEVIQSSGRREHIQQSDHLNNGYTVRQTTPTPRKETYILVVHVLQESEFAIRPLGVNGRLERTVQLLDGHPLVARRLDGSASQMI